MGKVEGYPVPKILTIDRNLSTFSVLTASRRGEAYGPC